MPALLNVSVEPKTSLGAAMLLDALADLVIYDPTLFFQADIETGQIVMQGASEAHLEGHIEALRSTYQIDALVGAQQVAHRETLGATTEIATPTRDRQAASSSTRKSKFCLNRSRTLALNSRTRSAAVFYQTSTSLRLRAASVFRRKPV